MKIKKIYYFLLLTLLSPHLFAAIFTQEINNHPQLDLIVIQDNFISFRYINSDNTVERPQLQAIKSLSNFGRFPNGGCYDDDHGLINHDLFRNASHFHLKFTTIDSQMLNGLFEILAISSLQCEQIVLHYLEFKAHNSRSAL